MEACKPYYALAVIGHVNSGKSTLAGHLAWLCGAVSREVIENYRVDEPGKAPFKYAWIFDRLIAERERGMTITSERLTFETRNFRMTLIDCPGHRDFIKNMISGVVLADYAVLAVSASQGEFEAGISAEGQTREHCLLAYTVGIKQLIVCVTKMDSVDWSKERFDEICKEVTDFIRKVGFQSQYSTFIPVSGEHGDNLNERNTNTPWYSGPTLLDAINAKPLPIRALDKPLRIPISEVYKVRGVGTVVMGRVVYGVIKTGMKVVVAPSEEGSTVRSLRIENESTDKGQPGDIVSFSLPFIHHDKIRRGAVVSDAEVDTAFETESFTAQIIILNHPGVIKAGYTPVISCHSATAPVLFYELLQKIDRRTGRFIEENPEELKSGDAAFVTLVPVKPICVEPFSCYPMLGRFILRDMRKTVGVGVIKAVEHYYVPEKPILQMPLKKSLKK